MELFNPRCSPSPIAAIMTDDALRARLGGAFNDARTLVFPPFFTSEYNRFRVYCSKDDSKPLIKTDAQYKMPWTHAENPGRQVCVGTTLVNIVNWFGFRYCTIGMRLAHRPVAAVDVATYMNIPMCAHVRIRTYAHIRMYANIHMCFFSLSFPF